MALGLLALGALPLGAQKGSKPVQGGRIVNVGYASAVTGNDIPIVAVPDTAIVTIASSKPRSNGTTLIAWDTVSTVCTMSDGRLRVSGAVTVHNGGEVATQGLALLIRVQFKRKTDKKYADLLGASQAITPAAQLQPDQKGRYPYTITFTPVPQAMYRTRSTVTITNHSGYLGVPFGPDPVGEFPSPPYPACVGGSTAPAEAPVIAAPLLVRLEASRLEVLAGEVLPLTATVENGSALPVEGPVARIALPPGLSYVEGSITGADSVRRTGAVLEVFLGRLEAGATHAIQLRLAATAAGASNMDVRLSAAAADGGAPSEVASVAVTTQRNRATETRAVIGKVWLDANRNGRQDDGEAGIAGVDVWTADGNIATTDSTGKFSFPDLRIGTHALRIDPVSVGPEYGVPGASRQGVSVRVTGWTTPSVLLPLTPRLAEVKEMRVAVRPVFLDPGYCLRAGTALGGGTAAVSGCGPVQLASRELDPGAAEPQIDVTLVAPTGSDEAAYPLRDGWELVRDGRATGRGASLVRSLRDRLGRRWVIARVDPRRGAATIRLREAVPDRPQPVRVSLVRTIRSDEEKARRRLVTGPAVEIFEPQDGRVLGTDRVYVGVRGEPGALVTLFDGEREIMQDFIRVDGQLDFASVRVAAGPHVLRVRMKNSWKFEHWDSVHVHTSGSPAALVPEHDALTLPSDPRGGTAARVRVLDKWGVPVVNRPFVTVDATGVQLTAPDLDRSSVGVQLRADTTGWVDIAFTSAREVGRGELAVSAGQVRTGIALDFVTAVRPLLLVGNGQLGIGAAPGAEGSLTIRGNLTETTALTVSVDSRGRDQSARRFGNTVDPLSEGVLPIIGDAAEQRSVGTGDGHLSVRLERGHSFGEYGDIRMDRALDGLSLLQHQRAVRGFNGRLRMMGIEWSGFGALSGQSFQQVQLRGAGTSGPYDLGGRVLSGTEQVTVEVRDPENAQHRLSRQRLSPYLDYEIDPERGILLLKQPLPALDMNGNPLFLVVSFEQQGGGPDRALWGVRARRNLLERRLGGTVKDSVTAGATYIRDDQVALGGLQLVGADLRVALGKRVAVRGEVVHAARTDSSDVALMMEGTYRPWGDKLTLGARWSSTGAEFRNPADLSLVPGTTDLRVSAVAQLRKGKVGFEHGAQTFGQDSSRRERSRLFLVQPLGAGLELESSVVDDDFAGVTTTQRSGIGDTKLTWRAHDRVRLWAEARRQLWTVGANQPWADHIGAGGALRLFGDLSLEARHLQVSAGDSSRYTVTDIGIRSTFAAGSRAWGSYQLTGGVSGSSNAAIVGLSNRFPLSRALTVNSMLERRTGVQRSAAGDPVRAQPFGQAESDYWSGGIGLELAPKGGTYHASAKTELKRGTLETSDLVMVAGDIAISQSLALLARHDWSVREWSNPGALADRSHRTASILGLALRPAQTNAINALVQFRMLEDARPTSTGVLSRFGRERRMLASAEAIWAPTARIEAGARCATRFTRAIEDTPDALASRAMFCGGRYDLGLTEHFVLRGEGRLLREQLGRTQRWDVAPSLLFRTNAGIELGGGYRLGDLQDPDFATRSGGGWFFTLGARASESSLTGIGEYWRGRIGRE